MAQVQRIAVPNDLGEFFGYLIMKCDFIATAYEELVWHKGDQPLKLLPNELNVAKEPKPAAEK